jgi:hypothetical protein
MIDTTPKAIDVYHTKLKAYAYASWLALVAAATTTALAPGTVAMLFGVVRNVDTNCIASWAGRPAFSTAAPTYCGKAFVSFSEKMLK